MDNGYQTEEQKVRSEEYKALRNLTIFDWYMRGARQAVMRLAEELKPNNAIDKAIFELLQNCSKDTLEKFLIHDYEEIRIKDHKLKKGYKPKEGKIIPESAYESVTAYLAEKREMWLDISRGENNDPGTV